MFESKRLRERREGLNLIEKILADRSRVIIIHHACESFRTKQGRAPRITSICVKFLQSYQSITFSFQIEAQIKKLDTHILTESHYDVLEKALLSKFFAFVRKYENYNWVHWNMKDANFGFEAINNRYRALGGRPTQIADEHKFDLRKIMDKLYTSDFETRDIGGKGKLLHLAERNDIYLYRSMTGAEEAEAFEDREFLRIHISTVRKADIITEILERIDTGEIKVAIGKVRIYGLTIPGIAEIVRNNWLLIIIWSILIYVMGAATEPVVQRLFGTAK